MYSPTLQFSFGLCAYPQNYARNGEINKQAGGVHQGAHGWAGDNGWIDVEGGS